MSSTRSTIFIIALVLIIANLSLGCSKTARTIRQFTYPPDFKYIETGEVHSVMRKLALDVRALNKVLRESDDVSKIQQEEVLRLLISIEGTASKLDPQGRSSNHPVLDRNILSFRRDIALARQSAEQEPPNYFLAGSAVGSCLYCHKDRG